MGAVGSRASTRPAPTRDELRARFAQLEEAYRGFPVLSSTLLDGDIARGELRQLVLYSVYDVPGEVTRRVTNARGWERARRVLPEVGSASDLRFPPSAQWVTLETRGRLPGEPARSPCPKCAGTWEPDECPGCKGAGKTPCRCREPQRAGCRKCMGSGLRRCRVCEGLGKRSRCPECLGGGVIVAYDEVRLRRVLDEKRVPFGEPVPAGFPEAWAQSLWRDEYRERGVRIGLGPAELARGYRDAPVRELDPAAADELARLLSSFAPRADGAVLCGQELVLRSLTFVGVQLPSRGGGFWIVGDARQEFDTVVRVGRGLGAGGWSALAFFATAGAFVAWLLTTR